ncbi:hemerythrin domain-containing protein [Paraburkholderia sp. MMS20-SJTR3]|uniref:Hemerythrin domain-containing protein n=1 Tax=Paraburkholderia sejongensis TaxID=2886946 RepID=A0ABS8JQX7_9BURK|nr:hemerythrin domain-containing protein [Paraburkholderia sp. MMS20-SJTR3]MCC8392268.1 hemerythrin domain-containing protein [Paraburkholderia sp. MMS20-SJTR3]
MPENVSSASPSITAMIRLDHMHVLAASHRYHASTPWWRKRAIVNGVCAALEIHAQLEEEIFYPALDRALGHDETLAKSRPEHDEMRATIAKLRAMGPENAAYDGLFHQLIREVVHHVADEETILLPDAERVLQSELQALGAQMTRRRLQLLGERPKEIALTTAGTFPIATLLIGSTLLLALRQCLPRSRRAARSRRWDERADD